MTSVNDNSAEKKFTVTVERWDEPGSLYGWFLTTLLIAGRPEPVDSRICDTIDEAFDVARDLLNEHPDAVFHNQVDHGPR